VSATVVNPEDVDAEDFARVRLGIVVVVSRSLAQRNKPEVVSRSLAQRNKPAETLSCVSSKFLIKIQGIKEEIYRTKMTCEQEDQTLDR
jgi:hypothetical protein